MTLIKDLLDVFRPLRWYRNGFMLLGVLLAVRFVNLEFPSICLQVIFSFIALCFVASGNYGINEILDASTDKYHPQKRTRAMASGRVPKQLIFWMSLLFYGIGFLIVVPFKNKALLCSLGLMCLSGILYNVKPFRFKEKPYFDFIFEAMNNPIRLLIGWYATAPNKIVPSSFLLAFWSLGVFLMASKRFGELRFIDDIEILSKYRSSLGFYTEKKLLFAMIASICTFNYMLGALSFKYAADVIIMLPLLIVWIIWFFALSYEKDSIVKDPERIFTKMGFFSFTLCLLGLFVLLLFSGNNIMMFLKW